MSRAECHEGYYGTDCGTLCTCVAANTASCDHVSGACTCKTGWTDGTCSTDVDECTAGTHNCMLGAPGHELCSNTVGGYTCSCEVGYYYQHLRACSGKSKTCW